LARKDRFSFFLLIFALVSVYFFVFSTCGILERNKLRKKYNALVEKNDSILSESKELRKRIEKYKTGEISDPDLYRSGYINNNTTALIFDSKKLYNTEQLNNYKSAGRSPVFFMRIGWVIFSLFIIYKFIKSKQSRVEE